MARAPRPPTRRVRSGKSGHRYIVDGQNYSGRGVTTLIGGGMPKPALIGWAARITAEAAVYERETWLPMATGGRPKAAIEWLKEARWQSTNEAALRGTDVHNLAARLADGETVEVDDTTGALVDAYLAFRADFMPTNEHAERMIVNRTHVYAGTFDLLADLEGYLWIPELEKAKHRLSEPELAALEAGELTERPARVLIDYKTSASGIYPEATVQLAAYRYAESMLPGLEANPEDELPMLPVDFCAVLWLRDDATYELRPVLADERAWKIFLYAAQISRFAGRDGWGDETIRNPIEPNVVLELEEVAS